MPSEKGQGQRKTKYPVENQHKENMWEKAGKKQVAQTIFLCCFSHLKDFIICLALYPASGWVLQDAFHLHGQRVGAVPREEVRTQGWGRWRTHVWINIQSSQLACWQYFWVKVINTSTRAHYLVLQTTEEPHWADLNTQGMLCPKPQVPNLPNGFLTLRHMPFT